MTDNRLVLTTCGSPEEARKIARVLVERRLAACVNIVPQVESVYRWEGKIESVAESLLLIKTTKAAYGRLQQALIDLHAYDNPECVELAIEDGSAPYLAWITDSVS